MSTHTSHIKSNEHHLNNLTYSILLRYDNYVEMYNLTFHCKRYYYLQLRLLRVITVTVTMSH